jgi:hypothetical protein
VKNNQLILMGSSGWDYYDAREPNICHTSQHLKGVDGT